VKQIEAAKAIGLGDPRTMRKKDLAEAIIAKLQLSKSEVTMSDLKKRKGDIIEHFLEKEFGMREPLSPRPHYEAPDPRLGEIDEAGALMERYGQSLEGRQLNTGGGGVGSLFRERRPMFAGGLPLKWGKGIINYFRKKIAQKAADKKFMADLDKKLFDEKGNLKEEAVEKHFQDMTESFQQQIDQRKQFLQATPPTDRKLNAQGGGVGSMFRRV
jgi:hypothetical protein